MPFDWQTPIGYFVAFQIELPSIYYATKMASYKFCCSIGPSGIMIAIADDIRMEMNALNVYTIQKRNEIELKKKLSEFIPFHAISKQ